MNDHTTVTSEAISTGSFHLVDWAKYENITGLAKYRTPLYVHEIYRLNIEIHIEIKI